MTEVLVEQQQAKAGYVDPALNECGHEDDADTEIRQLPQCFHVP
jgi:hypothetical protein